MSEHAAAGRVAAVIPAAGSGVRLGADVPKAFIEFNGLPLLAWAASAMSAVAEVIVVAVPKGYIQQASKVLQAIDSEIHIIEGGENRQASVALALTVLPEDVTVVLVHDAARPLVPMRVTSEVVQAVQTGLVGVVPVLPISDTVKRVDPNGMVIETVNRDLLRRVQTPQGFSRAILDIVHSDPTVAATDDAGLLELNGYPVATVPGDERAIKITTMQDVHTALSYLEEHHD